MDEPARRRGDAIEIAGDYQHKAIQSPNPVQRFWHETKKLVIADMLPPLPEDFALDVGCGSGVISSYLGQVSRRVLGIDGSRRAIEYATQTFAGGGVAFELGLVDELFAIDEAPNKIYCMEVIEHIHRDQGVQMLRCFHRLLPKDGRVLLTTPNYHSPWPLIEWGLDRFSNAPHLDGDQHIMQYTPRRIRAVAAESGFDVIELRTVSLFAPWLAALSWRLARTVHPIEAKWPFLPGCIIACVLAPSNPPDPAPLSANLG